MPPIFPLQVSGPLPSVTSDTVREAIAKAFPVVVDLFNHAGEPPHAALGDAWPVVLDVRAVYEKELERCRRSFDNIDWSSKVLADAPFNCPHCSSDLVAQLDPDNTDIQSAECECRSCRAKVDAENAVKRALQLHLEWDSYIAAKDGDEDVLCTCPQCGLLFDEWDEVIPSTDRDTGISFNFNRPDNEPPQTILVVTPASATGQWEWDDIVGALHETLDLAKKRAVEPTQLDSTPYAPLLPATTMAVTLYAISIGTSLAVANDALRNLGTAYNA